MVNKKSFSRVGLLAGLALLTTACSEAPAPMSPPPTKVTVVTLATEDVRLNRELPGRTTAFLVAEVRPQVNGIVEKRLFTEGGLVKAGEPLYQLDDATYRADLNSAKASLARAEAALESAKLTAERASELAKTGAVSRQEYDNLIATHRQAEAEVGVARAALERSHIVLGYARITSPINGRIGKSSVTQGALVTANQALPLATVQQLDPVYVDLVQSANELIALRKQLADGTLTETGDVPVTILLEDGSAYEHSGKMTFTDVTVDPSTGSFSLRVVVPNPDNILLPGMYVRARISTGKRKDGLLVPQPGVMRDPKGNTSVMLVNDEGVVEVRPVVVSHAIGDSWLIDSGVSAGDRVIVSGLQKVRPGVPVEALERDAEESTETDPAQAE